MNVLTIAVSKGGVGKTLISANLAAALAKKDHSVTYVDITGTLPVSYTHLTLPTTERV